MIQCNAIVLFHARSSFCWFSMGRVSRVAVGQGFDAGVLRGVALIGNASPSAVSLSVRVFLSVPCGEASNSQIPIDTMGAGAAKMLSFPEHSQSCF